MERRRTQRNSVADLQTMYKQQLTTLWSTVEGSQKYLPLVPGRHLVFETHEFVELNAATYKAKQSVSMFLLNDLLLIAGRRRMKSVHGDDKEPERGRMVAERCWVLADLVVVDVKDSGGESDYRHSACHPADPLRPDECFEDPPRQGGVRVSHSQT